MSEIKTDLIGGPLLYPHGGMNLQIMAFVAFQFAFIPITYLVLTIINKPRNELARKNYLKFWEKLGSEKSQGHEYMVLAILIVNLIAVSSYYFQYKVNLPFAIIYPSLLTSLIVLGLLLNIYSEGTVYKFIKNQQQKSFIALTSLLVTIITLLIKYDSIQGNLTKFFFYFGLVWLITSVLGINSFRDTSKRNEFKNLFIYLPAFIFLFYSRISGDVRALNPFESFQVSNARLMYEGLLPWKNFTVPHGLWSDALRNYLGGLLVDRTIWGQFQGIAAVVHPVEVLTFGVILYLISHKLFMTIGILGLVKLVEVLSNQDTSLTRMLPTLVIVFLLKNYLATPSSKRALLLGIVCGIQILWAFEGIYAVIGVLFLLFMNALYKSSSSTPIRNLTYYCFGAIASVVLPLFSLGLFEYWYREIRLDASGYVGAWGGLLFLWDLGFTYFILVLLVPIVVLIFLSISLRNIYLSRGISKDTYLWLLPLITGAAVFYLKFLQWPDWHIMQSASLVMLSFLLYYATLKERNIQTGITTLSIICLVWISLAPVATDGKYVKANTVNKVIGPADFGTNQYAERLLHVQGTFSKWLKPPHGANVEIFDFGNEPLSWFGILNYVPSNGFDKVLNFSSLKSQEIVIEELKRNPPTGIIWGGEVGYWQGLYNGTWMMQYRISQYILENFIPVASDGGYVLFKKKEIGQLPDVKALTQVKSVNCVWHEGVKNFISPEKVLVGDNIPVVPNISPNDDSKTQVKLVFKRAGNRQTIFASSSVATDVTLTSSGGSGAIHFVLPGDNIQHQIWLGGCPVWSLRAKDEVWVAKYGGESSNVKFYNGKF